jgi:hypothetical protein
LEIRTSFRANYEVEDPFELPNSGQGVLYFPPVSSNRGRTYSTRLRFAYVSQPPWYGVFATEFDEGVSFVSTMPDPDWTCVAAAGTGYILNVSDPQQWDGVPVGPVRQLVTAEDQEILLLSCFTRVVSYGKEGQKWITSPLCSDALRVVEIKGGIIACTGWDAPTDNEVFFNLDIRSGRKR